MCGLLGGGIGTIHHWGACGGGVAHQILESRVSPGNDDDDA